MTANHSRHDQPAVDANADVQKGHSPAIANPTPAEAIQDITSTKPIPNCDA